jgi:hypothetical protein
MQILAERLLQTISRPGSNTGMAMIRAKKYHEGPQSYASRVFRISKPCTIKFLRSCVLKQLLS